MHVISFKKHEDEVAATLEILAREARAGHITGMVYACRYAPGSQHKIGMSGVYRRDLVQAIGVSSWLLRQLHNLYERRVQNSD
jgi:hypothetical protein